MAKCLPSKHEDMNLINQNHVRTPAGVAMAVTLDVRRLKQEELTTVGILMWEVPGQ